MTDPKPARTDADLRRTLAEFSVPSEPGNERLAMETVAEAVRDLDIRGENLERLKTAVAEATMNAMEHGNKYRAEVPVEVVVLVEDRDLMVRITDRGSGPPPSQGGDAPDLEAKLEGMQTPRGWGLFLIKSMVDEMSITGDDGHHTIELRRSSRSGRRKVMAVRHLNVEVRLESDVAVLDLMGEINGFAEEALNAAYAEADAKDTKTILLNFEGVDYINSTGIALIVGLLAKARASHKRLLACNLSEHYVEIFNITRLSDFMSVFPDEESAVEEASVS